MATDDKVKAAEGAQLRPRAELLEMIDAMVAAWIVVPDPRGHETYSVLSEAAERIRADTQTSAPVEDVGGLAEKITALREWLERTRDERNFPPHLFGWCEEADARLATLIQPQASLQARVRPWMLACFNPEIAADKLERNDRFIEEALELIQASNYPKERAHALVEYVYGRPQGDINQEVGGVMITLAAHCLAHGVDMHEAGETELARINQPDIIVKIRAKQAAKPKGSALPIAALDQPQGEKQS